jgi:predicted acetyltransferase
MSDEGVAHRAPAPVEIIAVSSTEIGTLRNLFQFYEYDFSEIEEASVAEDGRFHQLDNTAFEQAYFIQANGELAGFALVNRKASHVVDSEVVWWMEEFFIMRRYRRASLGRHAAHLVIDRHPGTWEVTETPNNTAAIAFWRRVLAAYAYEDIEFVDPKWGPRPLQRFSTH